MSTSLKSVIVASMLFASASALLSSGVIFPLYFDPNNQKCTGWSSLNSTIATHPTLPFYIIINPDSGPAGVPGSQPDSTYRTCIPVLRAHKNVKIIGYVDTASPSGVLRKSAAVINDTDTYAQWHAAYRPSGIFYDDVTTSSKNVPTYRTYRARVKADFGANALTVLNPGTIPNAGYYSAADIIVTYESPYKTFKFSDLTIGSSTPAVKQSVITYSSPKTIPSTVIKKLVTLRASFFANNADYQVMPSNFAAFCSQLVAAQTT